jgi:putative ABC transport system permease protein
MWRDSLRFFMRRLFRRGALEADLRDEIESHLAIEARQRMERGESPPAAQAAALRQFGNVRLVAEVTRDMWGFSWLEHTVQDLRYAVRTLRNAPLFTVAVVLTLALSIGSASAIFTVVRGVLLRSLPFPDPDKLVMVWEVQPQTKRTNVVRLNNFVAWKERSRSFDSMAAFLQRPMNVLGGRRSEQVLGLAVTSEFFKVLGAPPLLGRTFRPGEYNRDAPRRVVLSHKIWRQRFGGDPNVIGQRISIDAAHHEIIGVMPAGFGFPNIQGNLYVPLAIEADEGRNYSVFGRLRPGISVASADAEIGAIAAHTAQENPLQNAGWSASVVPLLDQTVGAVRPVLLVLTAAVALVLLIACANIANLLLMRSARRSLEISVRLALGASRRRIVTQLLIESLVLACIGGALGSALGFGAVRLIQIKLPASLLIPRIYDVSVDWAVLAFCVLVTGLSAMLFGLAPALHATKENLGPALHERSRSGGSGHKLRGALVVAEVALALVLVAGAGLMVRSLMRLTRVDQGFHAEHVLTMRMLLLPVRTETFHAQVVNEVLRRVRSLPGVISAGSIGILPMQGTNSGSWYYRADRPDPPLNSRPVGDVSIITPGYFHTLGIPILSGRDFDQHDLLNANQVAIMNQAAVDMLFPGENPIGKRVRVWWSHSPIVEIVGVVANIRHSQLNSDPYPCLFLPNDQQPYRFSSLVVRTTGDPASLVPAIREQVRQVDADQGVAEIASLRQLVADSIARPRLETGLLAAFGSIALVLACIGIYGVIAYSVAQRSREIGIRVALGADRRSVFGMVLGGGLRLTALGIAIGLAGAAAVTRFLRTLLFEIQPDDPGTLIGVTALLLLVSLVACYFPASRAMRVDPAAVLREQ